MFVALKMNLILENPVEGTLEFLCCFVLETRFLYKFV